MDLLITVDICRWMHRVAALNWTIAVAMCMTVCNTITMLKFNLAKQIDNQEAMKNYMVPKVPLLNFLLFHLVQINVGKVSMKAMQEQL